MYSKRLVAISMLLICGLALPFSGSSANTQIVAAPLMPTKDPMAHSRPMQTYIIPERVLAVRYNGAVMVPLMATKDRQAHANNSMQAFPWNQQYPAFRPTARPSINTEAPLMPTKDPRAHDGPMQQDYLG